ncbi:hypothetical protein ACFLQL_00980 [Verrucomicrobiota bacterium]
MKMKSLLTWLFVVGSSICMSAYAESAAMGNSLTIAPLIQRTMLTASDGAALDVFGVATAVSSDGNTAIIGARGVHTNQGAAYVFTRSDGNWSQQAKLTASDGDANDLFGWSVALSDDGNTAIAGAYLADAGTNVFAGAAYVFTRSGDTWSQQQKLTAASGASLDAFGWSVALSSNGNTTIIGASMADVGGNNNEGMAYVFLRSGDTWGQQATLTAADGAASDGFGFFVALNSDGDTAIAGSYLADVAGITDQGAAYVFTRSVSNVWSQQGKLTASDGALNDEFGFSVALNDDGDTAIAGAHYADVGTNANQGAAYVFTRSSTNWSEQGKLTVWDGTASNLFGVSVALSSDGNTALASAPAADESGIINQGAVYLFTRSAGTWIDQQQLTYSGGAMNDQFGISVALDSDGDTAIVGANYVDVGTNANQGVAYVFVDIQPPSVITATYDFFIDRVQLTWGAAGGATGYKVWRGVSNDTALATNIGAVFSITNYDDMAATAGTPYYYWVTSTNWDGSSAFGGSAIGRVLFGPDVRVNGYAGPVTVSVGSELEVKVSINPAQYAGDPMDWWVAVIAPSGLYYLNDSMEWTMIALPVYQGGLFALQSYEVLSTTVLPAGTYTFYFGVDTLNGVLDPNVVYDSATAIIVP